MTPKRLRHIKAAQNRKHIFERKIFAQENKTAQLIERGKYEKPKAEVARGLKKWEEFNRASLNFNNGGHTQRLRANIAEGVNRTKVIQSWIWANSETPKIHLTGVLDK